MSSATSECWWLPPAVLSPALTSRSSQGPEQRCAGGARRVHPEARSAGPRLPSRVPGAEVLSHSSRGEMQACTLARVPVVNVDPYDQFWFTPLTSYTSNNVPERETSDGEGPFPPRAVSMEYHGGGGTLLGAGPCGVHFEKLTGH